MVRAAEVARCRRGSALADLVALLAASAAVALAAAASARALLAAWEARRAGAEVQVGSSAVEADVALPACPGLLSVDSGPARVRVCSETMPAEVRGTGGSRLWRVAVRVRSESGRTLSVAAVSSSCRHVAQRRVFDVYVAGAGAPVRWVSATVSWGGSPPGVMTRRLVRVYWLTRGRSLWLASSGVSSGSTVAFSSPAVFGRSVLRLTFNNQFPSPASLWLSVALNPDIAVGPAAVWPAYCEVNL